MVAMVAFVLAATSAGPAQQNVCLLAGPSRTLVAVALEARQSEYILRPISGQVWVFSGNSLTLAPLPPTSPGQPPYHFEARDRSARMAAGLWTGYAERGGLTLRVERGESSNDDLPLLIGSCAPTESDAARSYLSQAQNSAAIAQPDANRYRTGRLRASNECQVVSAAGWVSRFAMEHRQDASGMTIRPFDQRLWAAPSLEARRLDPPFPPNPGSVRQLAGMAEYSSPGPRAITSIWVHATPDGQQSSIRMSFFGYDPEGPIQGEDLSGVCTVFVEGDAR